MALFYYFYFQADAGKNAVMLQSPAFSIPDSTSESTYFEEGSPVRIITRSGFWIYVESENGSTGWVQKDNLIIY
jgi:hypothetical protein